MDEAGVRTLADTFRGLFHVLHDGFRKQVRGLDHGTLNWRPLPLRSVRVVATERDRESEFKVEAEAENLLALLDEADREVDELLGGLTAEDLTENRPRGENEPRPGLYWLISNYGHAREHLAQIELTKQIYDSRT